MAEELSLIQPADAPIPCEISGLREEDSVSASRLSSLAPAGEKRSRKRSSCLGLIGVDLEAAIEKRLDDGAMRNLDRNMDMFRLAAACGDEPIAHLREPLAAVFKGPFAEALAAGIGKPDIVLLGRPVDARKPT